MTTKIELLDCVMSAGKTQGIIKYMLENPSNNYLYISPMLTEVQDRIPNSAEALGFVSPNTNQHRTKGEHLLQLLMEGANISFTHALFKEMTFQHLDWIHMQGYILVIDEEISFIEPYKEYTEDDFISLMDKGLMGIDKDKYNQVVWQWKDMKDNTRYSRLRNMCDMEMIYSAPRKKGMLVLQMPVNLISACERVILLTYQYKDSIMDSFMRLKGIESEPVDYIDLIRSEQEVKEYARERLQFIEPTISMKKVYKYSLSSTWWNKTATVDQIKAVNSAIQAACRQSKQSSDKVMWTAPKGATTEGYKKSKGNSPKHKLSVHGYASDKCFLYCSCRATNDYQHKTVLVHAYNRFPELSVESYLQDFGYNVSRDNYALNELIQWVWRSSIRDWDNPEPVQVAILSQRMDELFKNWLYLD